MITRGQYFAKKLGNPEITAAIEEAADTLLGKVNALLDYAASEGAYEAPVDADTGSQISGSKGGDGDGGLRLSTSKTGGPGSKHRTAHAVDVYDPGNKLDNWLTDEILEQFGLYRETPTATNGWCHLQDVPPGSGKRTYNI